MISSTFAELLAAGRPQFNARAQEARRRFATLDMAAFAAFLRDGVDPLVVAVADHAPERAGSVAFAAYDMALELVGHGLAGPSAKNQAVNDCWRELLPAMAPLVATAPAEVLALASNAAVHLAGVAGARPAQWRRELQALAPQVDSVATLRALGQLLAWRAGVAHFRAGALAAADNLPPALALAAFEVPASAPAPDWPALRAQLLASPWHGNAIGVEVGAFTGLGGDFATPPQVRASSEGFVVHSGERYFFLLADAYGAVLHGATEEEYAQAGSEAPAGVQLREAAIVIGTREFALDLPTGQIEVCANAHTVAVSSPYTHAIRLLPRT
ncbi:polysaccharide deacetylase family protein [Janthinobacterium aquaticum]|uniref:hypothetical protein n=1 Tax=Janthinobacterium sp. FT58W TaxID=2654254 RepID=UPI001264E742|nr:hypothetical protein [Janthinobacterium sp. FT58W]KAB8044285.1 hypothetical protein GCM43_03475 [Janthinobacterium sp. FT58W]